MNIQNQLTQGPAPDPSETPNLTEWQKEPSILDLHADFEIAKPAHDAHVSRVQNWLNLRDATGKHQPKRVQGRSSVQPKLVRKQAEWRYPSLSEPFLSAQDLYKVDPVTFEDRDAARQNHLVLNNQFRTKMKRVHFVDEVVRTFVDEGSVVVELGWHRETKPVQKQVYEFYQLDPRNPEDEPAMQMLAEALELRAANYNEYLNLPEEIQEAVEFTLEEETPVTAVPLEGEFYEEEEVVKNHPTAEVVHYENFYLDPSAEGDVDKAGFAVVSFTTYKAALEKDGRYKNLDKVNWGSNTPITNPEHHTTADHTHQYQDDARRRVVAHKYWGWRDIDGSGQLTPILATWIGNTIIRLEKLWTPDGKLPIVIMKYLPRKKEAFGEPDAELLEDNQSILGALTRGMIDLMARSANGQTGYAKGMLDPVNRQRLDAGQDYEFNPNVDPRIGVHHHTYPEIPTSALNMYQMQNAEAEAMSGVKAFSGGLSGDAYGDVATAVKGILDAASKREMAILRRLAEGFKEIGEKLIAYNAEFLTEEEVIRITNDEFVTVRRDELGGEFDLIVDISTAEQEAAQAQDLAFMLQTMGNNLPFDMTKMILIKIAKLKRMPDLAKMIEEYQPQPDPLEQAREQAEIAKLQLETQEIQSKIALNRAKARAELADADLKDLDFLEQESGTKHARDVDKIQAQAESNSSLEITKGILAQGENGPSDANVRKAVAYDRITKALTDRRTD